MKKILIILFVLINTKMNKTEKQIKKSLINQFLTGEQKEENTTEEKEVGNYLNQNTYINSPKKKFKKR
jgi:hypothetical protein